MRYYFLTILITVLSFLTKAQNQQDHWETLNTTFGDMSGIIYAPAKDTLFIHRMDGALLRSFNAGVNWDSTFIRHDSIKFTDVGSTFINGKTGFTWGIWGCIYTGIKQEKTVLLKTNNSGTNWEIAMSGLPISDVKNISLVHFWDTDNGILVAECGGSHHENHTYVTFDGAQTWLESSVFNPELTYAPRMATFVDRYTGVMCGMEMNLKFSLTDNGGANWNNTQLHPLNYSPTGIKLFNNNAGFILANDSAYLTDNNFKNITRKALPFKNYNNTVLSNNASYYAYDNNISYFLTFNNGIYKTTDGLNSFQVSKQKNNLPNYSIAGYHEDVYVYGLNGNLYKTTIGNSISNQSPLIKNTVTIYPNPTSGNELYIQSDVKITSYKISNILGEVLDVKSIQNNGQIDISALNSGSYILSLFNNVNELIDSKKIIKLQ